MLCNPVLLSCVHRFCFSCVATAALYAGADAAGGNTAHTASSGLRVACPVCRKPQVLDDGALRVDPALDDFIRDHFAPSTPPQAPAAQLHDARPGYEAEGEEEGNERGGDGQAQPCFPAPPRARHLPPHLSTHKEAAASVSTPSHLPPPRAPPPDSAGAPPPPAPPAPSPAPPPPLRPQLSVASAALRAACRLPKLLLIGVDGCRPDALLLADAPTSRALVTGGGAFSFFGAPDAHAPGGAPSAPADAWEALLTGRPPGGFGSGSGGFGPPSASWKAGARVSSSSSSSAGPPLTLFGLLACVRPWLRPALVCSLPQLAARVRGEPGCPAPEPAPSDAHAATSMLALLSAPSCPDVACLQLGEVHAAGLAHGFGPHVAQYTAAIAAADRRIGALVDCLRRRTAVAPSEDWLVVVTSSGGGTSREDMPPGLEQAAAAAEWRRSHGGGGAGAGGGEPPSKPRTDGSASSAPPSQHAGVFGASGMPQHEHAFWLVWGCGVKPGEVLPCPRPVDVAPTVLAHFGVFPRPEWDLPGRAVACVTGAAGWARAAARLDPLPSPRATAAAAPSHLPSPTRPPPPPSAPDHPPAPPSPPSAAQAAAVAAAMAALPGAVDALRVSAVAAAAASVAAAGSPAALAFFASVPGLLDPTPCAVIGHRGCGLNAGPRSGSAVRENTVESFAAAAASGATWVEFDVQVTLDGVPVIWHDDEVLTAGDDGRVRSLPVSSLTYEQFVACGPRPAEQPPPPPPPLTPAGACGVPGSGGSSSASPSPGRPALGGGRRACALLRRFGGSGVGGEQPWECPIEGPLPSLAAAFASSPPLLGFNVELKFVEPGGEHPPPTPAARSAALRSILAVCDASAGDRRVLFSSFDPDAAVEMRSLTSRWPVMLLTDCAGDPGSPWEMHSDPRRNGLRSALAVALAAGLAGVVPEAAALLASPRLAAEVRATGLLCVTWGAANSGAGAARTQAGLGVCGVITDAPADIAAALGSHSQHTLHGVGMSSSSPELSTASSSTSSASASSSASALPASPHGFAPAPRAAAPSAAPPAVRASVGALPLFLGGRGALPDAALRAHPLSALSFVSAAGDVAASFEADGAVRVSQTPLFADRQFGEEKASRGGDDGGGYGGDDDASSGALHAAMAAAAAAAERRTHGGGVAAFAGPSGRASAPAQYQAQNVQGAQQHPAACACRVGKACAACAAACGRAALGARAAALALSHNAPPRCAAPAAASPAAVSSSAAQVAAAVGYGWAGSGMGGAAASAAGVPQGFHSFGGSGTIGNLYAVGKGVSAEAAAAAAPPRGQSTVRMGLAALLAPQPRLWRAPGV